jgi:hypothetical protein
MNASDKIIKLSQLKSGDVLLCPVEGAIANKITRKSNSKYAHAAICYSPEEAVESSGDGVQKVLIHKLVSLYSHVAVFRNPVAWPIQRVLVMNKFLDSIISKKCKYNLKSVMNFVKIKEIHEQELPGKLASYFDAKHQPNSFVKEAYFCSELVADCFAASGFIDPSASILYKSDTIAPGDLGRDSTFGTFVGYLTSGDASNIPDDDEFISVTTLAEFLGHR